MPLFAFLFILLLCSENSYSQYNPGARQISLANSDVALSNDVFSLFNNPAGLSQINWREVGIYYSPAPFGLKELANGFVSYHEPLSFGSIALGGMTYGYELYRETRIVIGYSYNYENKFFAGVAVNYHNVSIEGYGNEAAFFLNLGGLVYLTDIIRWGFSVINVNRATVSEFDDQLPVIFNSGFSVDVIEDFSLNAAIEKDLNYKPSLLFGMDYDIIEYLSLRTGYSNEPARFSAGVGINYSIFSLDYAIFTHQDLGLTHQAGIIISFGKEGTRNRLIKNHLGKP